MVAVAVLLAVAVPRVVPRLLSNLTDMLVFLLPVVRKISWSPRTWFPVKQFTVKSVFPLMVLMAPRLNTVFGTLSDPSWPLLSWVVSTIFTLVLARRSSIWVLLPVPPSLMLLMLSVLKVPSTVLNSLTVLVVI